MPDNKISKKLPKRTGNPKRKASRAQAWERGQDRRKARQAAQKVREEANNKVRQATGTCSTDDKWGSLKDRQREKRTLFRLEKANSEWMRSVGRVRGPRPRFGKGGVKIYGKDGREVKTMT